MKIQRFEDIIAWQRAQDLAVNVYEHFKDNKDWDFKNQICRATISISNNIAEGFDRSSKADFRRFLYIALASCSETKSMLYLAQRLNYLNKETTAQIINQTIEISKILNGLIKSLSPVSKQ